MKKYILAIALIFLSYPIYAQSKKITAQEFVANDEWRLFATSKNKSKFYTKGIQIKGDAYDFWLKIEKVELSECNLNPNPFLQSPIDVETCNILKRKKTKVSITHEIISCKTSKSKTFSGINYNYNDDVIGSIDEEEKWEDIFPDTVYESIYIKLCQL